MQTSIFLARLIGPVALAIGLAILLDRERFRGLANEFLKSPALIFLSGVITLPAGLAIVLSHNIWTPDWRSLITLLGWLAVGGGGVRIFWPQRAASGGRGLLANPVTLLVAAAIWLAIGAILSFCGYAR